MEKERIIEILNTWNFWYKDYNTGIEREQYLEKLSKLSKTGQILSIVGVRRSGKSTILKQYIKKLIHTGINRKNTLYINFEEPKFLDVLNLQFLQEVYDAYLEIIKPTDKPYIFLDEIQNIPKWEVFVRALNEKDEANIFVSGSSSKLLSKEFGSILTGRHIDIPVYPLNFKEFLKFKGVVFKDSDKGNILSKKIQIKQLLREYIETGSFPLIALKEEKEEILAGYFDDILTKDIVERYKIKKVDKIKILAKYYLTNISSLCSFRKIKNFIGVSLDSIERFSYYMNYSYLIFFVNKFAYSLKEQETNPKKVYCIDTGLRNITGFKFSEDLGKLYENLVFLDLIRNNQEIFYWKGKYECDFIVKEKNTIIKVIQVCYNLNEENKKRETEGLIESMNKFKLKEGLIITEDMEKQEKVNNKIIKYIPLWKYLLK